MSSTNNNNVVIGTLTSTTAPGKVFTTRAELAEHYKSDWHKYNLKRREANLPLLVESEFQARWEAALALRQEQQKASSIAGKAHLKNKNNKKDNKKQNNKKVFQGGGGGDVAISEEEDGDDKNVTKVHPKETPESQENPGINPLQSLFDSNLSPTLEENVKYMEQKYGFFVPDREHLVDLEGFLGYCQEKIKLGHYCLYCEKMSKTWQGCQKHMIQKQHCKLRYETGYWDELDVFYDFKTDNERFLQQHQTQKEGAENDADGCDDAMEVSNENNDGEDGGGWEDVSEGGEDVDMETGVDDEDEDTLYGGYEKEIARFGLDVTPLGELVFPDGRIVGHRALQRYYKQRPRPANSSTALVAAQQVAGERMYQGRVVNINPHQQIGGGSGGSGKGILVPSKDATGTVVSFSALSLYRYRAVIRKQRRDDEYGRRLQNRSKLNINRMDKKGNRLMNGINVQMALR